MVALDELAAELILIIATTLAPVDAFNFAITSRTLWQQCRVVIEEHQLLAKQYSRIVVEGFRFTPGDAEDYPNESLSKSAWAIFRAICQDPRIAYHVREIENPSQGWDERDLGVEKEERRLCHEAAGNTTAVVGINTSKLNEAIDSQDYLQLFFLLLEICPNIKTLSYKDGMEEDFSPFEEFFDRQMSDAGSIRPGALQKLKNAFVEHWDTEYSIAPDYLFCLAQIPSLRSLTGSGIGTGTYDEPLRFPTSNLTTLELNNSNIDVKSLESIISLIKALEHFTYIDGGALVGDQELDLCGMISILAKYQGHSLLSLDITAGGSTWPEDRLDGVELAPFSGFKGFTKLESLSTELRIFAVRKSNDEGEDYLRPLDKSIELGNDLPETLQRLSIFHAVSRFTDLVEVMTANLIKSKQTHTPRLQYLSIPGVRVFSLDADGKAAQIEGWKELEAACEAQGVELI